MDVKPFHHALKIKEDQCIGCSHCMQVCPTEAIRVKNGKAVLEPNRCVDCGECFRVCPVLAIIIEQDDFNRIFDYKVRVALVPAVFIGQFPEEIPAEQVYSVLLELGFTHVYEVEHGAEVLLKAENDYIREHLEQHPVISGFCPAIVRLIQVKFPALVENIMLLKAPVDIAAMYKKQFYIDRGYNEEEVGIFYITPCAAKIAAIKSPVGEEKSEITGVINMNFIFNKVYSAIKQHKGESCAVPEISDLSHRCVLWSLTNGESDNVRGRSLAIDGIHNVMEFLEKLENDDDTDICFLELRACDESCPGGVLTSNNRFLTVERLRNRADGNKRYRNVKPLHQSGIIDQKERLLPRMVLDKVKPRSMMKLDEDMSEAMKKMKKVHELMRYLPQVDCSACGSPSCSSFAEDIVQGKAEITRCIFIQRALEKRGIMSSEEAIRIVESTWGIDKLKKKW
jgi:iron only hydrogenase large subunit-like protein